MYKNSKAERQILEVAQKHLKAMRKEFHKNDSFRKEIGIPPPEFEIPENYNEKEEKEKSQTPETTTKDQNQAEKPADIDN